MSGKAWDPHGAARSREARVAVELDGIELPPTQQFFGQLRFYLQRMTDRGRLTKGARSLSQLETTEGHTQINVGPTIFRAPCENCLIFRSGAQLSFGITLRVNGSYSRLIAYRFHLNLVQSSGLRFIRIDLNPPNQNTTQCTCPDHTCTRGSNMCTSRFRRCIQWRCWTGSST